MLGWVVFFFFLNPLIDFQGSNDASPRLMWLQCARHDLHSLRKHRLRKLPGLPLGRECSGLSGGRRRLQPPLLRRFDRNKPSIGNHRASGHGEPHWLICPRLGHVLSGRTDADQFCFRTFVRNCHLSDKLGEADDVCSRGKSQTLRLQAPTSEIEPKLTFESLRLDARCQNSFCPFLAVGFDPFCSLFRRVGEWLEAKRDQAFCHVR